MSKLAELKAALEAATPGPWKVLNGDRRNKNMHQKIGPIIAKKPLSQEDVKIIANAPEWLAKLIAVAEAAEAVLPLYADTLPDPDTLEHAYFSDAADALRKALEELNDE